MIFDPLPPAAREYLSHQSLAPLWAALRKRLEGNGLQVVGVLTPDLDETGIDHLAGLLGRRVINPPKVPLAELDTALRNSAAAAGVITVTVAITGPLEDRKAAKAAKAANRASVAMLLETSLATAGLGNQEWVPRFLESVRVSGVLTKAGIGAELAISQTGSVLSELASMGALAAPASRSHPIDAWTGLAELASRHTGDAHGLDRERVVAALVLKDAAAALERQAPESARDVRTLWSELGITPDDVSGSVLVLGLRPPGGDEWSAMMRARAHLGLVTHLTLHELTGPAAWIPWTEPGTVVSVCENPQVIQTAARAGIDRPLVCTSGNASSAGWAMLRGLVGQGVRVRYHGDFDWDGMAIAGRVLETGAEPWRLSTADYQAAVTAASTTSRLALSQRPVKTPWDPGFAAEMIRSGVAVHEESLLNVLLGDLSACDS